MIRRVFIVAFVSLLLFASLCAQETQEDGKKVILPDEIMRQVIGRILSYKYKPRSRPTIIPLAKTQVKNEWLPKIKNVTFKLVPDKELPDYEKGVLLLESVERDGKLFSINVGWGDLDCGATGDTWKFRLVSGQVRLWLTQSSWWRGCGGLGSSPPVIRRLKLGDVSPNELRGYEFFRNGKLKEIRLGISTRENIKSLFGLDCEELCDYDQNWNMRAEYISNGVAWTTTEGDDEKEYLAMAEFVGKLESLSFSPKKRIPFSHVIFPRKRFSNGKQMSIGDAWDLDGFAGAVHTSYEIYEDGYGLQYTIYNEETFNNLRDKRKSETKNEKGDLIRIGYSLPDSLKDKVFYSRPVKKQ